LDQWEGPVPKRLFDITVSASALLALAPVLLAIGLAIKLGSPGPVLFRQRRLGRGFVPFDILKFRTLSQHAECGLRPTWVGDILRRYKLNELPQLVNVLVGEMSLVGPRPELPCNVERFGKDFTFLLSVRPGITDAASIAYCREADLLATFDDPEGAYVEHILPHKIALARRGIEASSMLGDMRLLASTISVVLGRRPPPPCPQADDPIP